VPDYQNALAGSLVNLGILLHQRKDEQGALRFLQEALLHHQAALQANPRNSIYREFFWKNCLNRALILKSQGDHAAVAGVAEDWARIQHKSGSDAYKAACFLALCVPLAEKDPRLNETQRKETSQTYAERAMPLLRQAIVEGFKDVTHMKKDSDLDPLRDRDDFKKLVQDLEKLPQTPGK
jgi:hypothetical protein